MSRARRSSSTGDGARSSLALLSVSERFTFRVVFDWTERLVGGPLERAVNTEEFIDTLAQGVLTANAARRLGDAVLASLMHRLNHAARTGFTQLEEEVQRLDARIRELTDAVEAQAPAKRRPTPRPRTR